MKTGIKIGIAVASLVGLIFGGIALKKNSDKKKAAAAASDAQAAAAEAKANAASQAKTAAEAQARSQAAAIAQTQAIAAANKAAADLVRANTEANIAAKAAADKAAADAKAAADKAAADAAAQKAAADKAAADAAAQQQAIVDRVMAILSVIDNGGKFPDFDSASYFIANFNVIDVNKKPSIDRIKEALKNSNMAFYDGVVSQRLSNDDMVKEFAKFAPQGSNSWGSHSLISFNGGFGSPNFSAFTDYNLKKYLAHGWWFGLWHDGSTGSGNGGYQMANNAYVVVPQNLWGSNDSRVSGLTIPAQYKGGTYTYAFGGDSFSNFSSEISNLPTDLHN